MNKLKAVIFDLDGVITQTALVHSLAWKEMFDNYLREREQKYGESFREFTHEADYLTYVDGKPRYEGVKSFLSSRGINIEFGDPSDRTTQETICGIGNRKNDAFNEILERDGVKGYPSTLKLMQQLKDEGIRIGVASSSKNCEKVLAAAGLLEMVETRIDGVVSAERGLKGKPEADIFTTAADELGVDYHNAVVVEDAISGVQAGKKGNFGLVLGLAREDNHQALYANGADIVVSDIAEIGLEGIRRWFDTGIENDSWEILFRDYDPFKERSREALLSVGNGYFGTRGAMEEMEINSINYPATYMAGVYNRRTSQVAGRDVENEDLVNLSNWLPVTFKVEDEDYLDLNKTRILEICRRMDVRKGVLHRSMIVEDQKGRRTQLVSRRFASMKDPHLAALEYTITPLNYSAKITLRSMLTGDHINEGVARYAELDQHHLEAVEAWSVGNLQSLEVCTRQSDIRVQQIARLDVSLGKEMLFPTYESTNEGGRSTLWFSVEITQGRPLRLQKSVVMNNSVQKDLYLTAPLDILNNAGSFEDILQASAEAWERIWQRIDIKIAGDRHSQKLLRLHLYHLLSTSSPNNVNIDFGIPARGLTGEAYRGHIFWDELYILPLYFLHYPAIARAILMYRYRRLGEARNYAKEFGYQGAMFPWQSGSDGREETQKFHFNPLSGRWGDDHSSLQRHVNLAIAYNIIQYYRHSVDQEFMLKYGAEMLCEICRLWESMAVKELPSGRYSIAKVMGPDEFHEHLPGSPQSGLKDNAYTNVMTAWMFRETLQFIEELETEDAEALKENLGFSDEERLRWKDISLKLNLHIQQNIIAQFEGYFGLKDLDWDHYRKKYTNIYRMDRILKAEGLSPDEFKLAKQADVLMLFYNLDREKVSEIIQGFGYTLSEDYLKSNFDYYLPRTSHGSTLSRVVHAYLASQIGMPDLAWEMYSEALGSDLNDIQGGTTAEGIHTGVMAGTVMIALRAYAGINTNGKVLIVNPELPERWKKMTFSIRFKGVRFSIELDAYSLNITADVDSSFEHMGEIFSLKKGVTKHIILKR